jgi:Flp pilus assembly pilin Flp
MKKLWQHYLRQRPQVNEDGQGLVEYAILFAFIALVVYVIVQLLEPTIGNVFSNFVANAPVAPPSLINYTPPATYTLTPTEDPAASPTPFPTITLVPSATPTITPTNTATPTMTPTPLPPCPITGPFTVPGTVQMENFRCGGQGVAFLDSPASGPGSNPPRTDIAIGEGPDLATTTDTGGGYHLGWMNAGEWVEYEVSAPLAQSYILRMRYAAPTGVFPSLTIDVTDGVFSDGPFTISGGPTGGWDVWGETEVLVSLFAGTNIIRFTSNSAATNGNFNYFDIVNFVPTATATAPPTFTPLPSNTPAPTNTPTNTPLPTATFTPTPTPSPIPTGILFVVNTPIIAADTAVQTRLTSLGYTVTTIDDDTVVTGDATNKVLVVISSSVNSGDVNTKFKDVPQPVLLWESGLYDDMQMTSTSGTDNNETQIRIINAGHPLAAGLANGLRTVTSSGQTFTWGLPNTATAILVAEIDNDTDQYTIFAYQTGSTMVGMSAPGPRVGFFLENNTAAAWNGNGQALFNAAVSWAVSQ